MGNAQGVLHNEEEIKDLFNKSIFNPKGSFYHAYTDPDRLKQMREDYEKQLAIEKAREDSINKTSNTSSSKEKN